MEPKLLLEANLAETANRVCTTIAWHRCLWLLLSTSAVFVATLGVLSRISNRYAPEATLLVIQQQVPQRYVTSTSTTDIREALQATTQEVLSRTWLLQIIDEFGLYAKERKRLSPEGLLDLIRRDIGIEPIE